MRGRLGSLRLISRSFSSYNTILTELKGATQIITLNRPRNLNAINAELAKELVHALEAAQASPEVRSAILTGAGEKAFAAGADIKEMKDLTYSDVLQQAFLENLDAVHRFRKPLIAAVNGYALGGGFELALMCDIIYAGPNARFGLPEVTLGTIPGAGGTQRLIRAVGKSKAMEMILSAEQVDANEAVRLGIASKVAKDLLPEAIALAEKINHFSTFTTQVAKDAVKVAEEVGLSEGLKTEKRLFWATFATEDRKEGMTAFAEKRPAHFKHK